MHDPLTLAFTIPLPWKKYGKNGKSDFERGYREPLISIWHRDPEHHGSDDSCGWFMRAGHGDRAVCKAIKGDFEFNWDADYGGWFDKAGKPTMSPMAITLGMFHAATWQHFRHDPHKRERFIRTHLADILHFAENPIDSMLTSINGKYGIEPRGDRIASAASIVYGCVLRWARPWYRHPRWHFWHWEFQVHPWQTFRRWAFSRCCKCGGRFSWGYSPVSGNWDHIKPKLFCSEVGVYHGDCARPSDHCCVAAKASA